MQFLESPLVIGFIGLVGAWFVGNALAARWQLIRKRKEMELETAQRFYEHYGEFFAIWKLWNQWLEDLGGTQTDLLEERRKELYDRAAAMEGALEATLLKVASEIVLSDSEQKTLGQLRQAFGVVRYCIKNRKKIPYYSSHNEMYLKLKQLSTEFGLLLAKPLTRSWSSILASVPMPTTQQAKDAWEEITHNKYEEEWKGFLKRRWSGACSGGFYNRQEEP